MTSLNHNYIPNAPPRNTITLGVRPLTYEFAGGWGYEGLASNTISKPTHKDKGPLGK